MIRCDNEDTLIMIIVFEIKFIMMMAEDDDEFIMMMAKDDDLMIMMVMIIMTM